MKMKEAMNMVGNLASDNVELTPEDRRFQGNAHNREKIIHRSENAIIVANPLGA